jgi:hypothetical protein
VTWLWLYFVLNVTHPNVANITDKNRSLSTLKFHRIRSKLTFDSCYSEPSSRQIAKKITVHHNRDRHNHHHSLQTNLYRVWRRASRRLSKRHGVSLRRATLRENTPSQNRTRHATHTQASLCDTTKSQMTPILTSPRYAIHYLATTVQAVSTITCVAMACLFVQIRHSDCR